MFDVKDSALLDQADQLKDAVVFITGGASGFGAATARTVSKHGAKVFIVDLNESSMAALVHELQSRGGKAASAKADVTNMDQVRATFKKCEETLGTPDIVYANAGINSKEDALELDEFGTKPGPWNDMTLRVNMGGTLLTAAAAQEAWIASPEAKRPRRLILTASMGGFAPIPGGSCYAASKHGTVAYWKAINDALARGDLKGFECHTVCPFFSATAILPRAMLAILSGIPLVPVSLVADALIYAGCGCPGSKGVDKGNGDAILLMDPSTATIIPADEYGIHSKEQERNLNARLEEGQSAFAPYWQRFWGDLYNAIFGARINDAVKPAAAVKPAVTA